MPPTARPIAQPLGHGAAAAAIPLPSHAMPPARTETYPSAESGGLAEGVSARRSPTAPNPADLNVPTLGTFTATNSKYYSGQVIDAVSGTHYDAATGQVTAGPAAARREPDIEFHWDDNEVGSTRQLSRYAAFFAALLLVTGLCAHLFQAFYVIPLVLAQLAAGLLLPVMRVVPWQDEDSDDLWWLLGFSLVFGPGIGLIAYGVKALLLQEYNTAVIGIFIVGLLIYLATMIGAGGFTMLELAPPWTQVSKYGIEQLFVNWTVLVAMAGWFLGNVFHKFDQ